MSLILQTVPQQLSSETPVAGSWKFLAGTTDTNTIKNSNGIPLQRVAMLGSPSNFVTYNNTPVIGLGDGNKALVAKRNSNSGWTLLGGDQGLVSGIQHTYQGLPYTVTTRRLKALTVFNGNLYACFTEEIPGLTSSAGVPLGMNEWAYIARWNEPGNQWDILTPGTKGIQESFTKDLSGGSWTRVLVSVSTDSGRFCVINGDLFFVFDEEYRTRAALVTQIDHQATAMKVSGASVTRHAEAALFQVIDMSSVSVTYNNNFFFYYWNNASWVAYKFDGTSFSKVIEAGNGDPGYINTRYINGVSFQVYDGKIRMLYNN